MDQMDDDLTASERRAAKRRERVEAGRAAPAWAKIVAWSVLGVAAVAVLFALLSAGPPKYGVMDTETQDGVTGYTVGVASWDQNYPEQIVRDLWTKNGGNIVVRIMCTSNPLDQRYLGGGTQSTAGNAAVTSAPNAKCP